MINTEDALIEEVSLHRVGNKSADDGCIYSKHSLMLNDTLRGLLSRYFLPPFKSEEYFHFYHDTNLNLNEVYTYVTEIFNNPDNLHDQSINLAKHLYDKSEHPNIKAGDFYTVYFDSVYLDGEEVNAVGLFKSENKDTFLRVLAENSEFTLQSEQGINIKKLDKGCLILNTEREQGYVCAVIDNTNRNMEAQYWIEDFLHVTQRQDDYYHTQNIMALTKNFVVNALPEQLDEFEVSRADQAAILNDSIKFFKEKESFTMEEFNQEVLQQPEIIDSFQEYKANFLRDNDLRMPESFEISDSAVKKQTRAFKSVIKLDKNFHIYIHGDHNLIERGEDEKGKFYKVYYKEEQ